MILIRPTSSGDKMPATNSCDAKANNCINAFAESKWKNPFLKKFLNTVVICFQNDFIYSKCNVYAAKRVST